MDLIKSYNRSDWSSAFDTYYLSEREWFIKKFEAAVGKKVSKSKKPFACLERDIRCRKLCNIEWHLCGEYKERPRPHDIPDIVWDGPPLNTCFCCSPFGNCDCSVVYPPRRLPLGIFSKIIRLLQNLSLKYRIWRVGTLPKQQFQVKKLQEHVKTEALVQNKLKQMNLNRGPEFCIFKCCHYYNPSRGEINKYFLIKQKLRTAYKKKPLPVAKSAVAKSTVAKSAVAKSSVSDIDDEIIDGLYRSVSTQATTDENGEFVIGNVSHILFGNATVYQDIEGTPYNVRTVEEIVTQKPDPLVKKLENLLSISRIKNRVSKLTSSLMSSIVEIEDTGIPINTRGTQDPSLDKYFESIKEPSVFKVDKAKEEVCPCCKYKELQTIENDRDENDSIDSYDDFVSEGAESLFYTPFERRRLRISDYDKQQTLPVKYNFPSEGRKNDENEFKLKNVNDNIELLKQDLMINKQVKKYTRNTLSKSMLNVEGNKTEQNTGKPAHGLFKGIDKKNNQMNSLEFLESIKPCCIDILSKQLEIKISILNYFKKMLENEVFRRVYHRIYKITEKCQSNNNNNNNNNNINTKIDSADLPVKKSKQVKFSHSGTNMDEFSNFDKNEKSSLKVFDKKIEEAHIKLKSRKSLSFQDFKVKIKKSLKKMNNAMSSFFKRYCTKSSNNIKQLKNEVICSVSEAADHFSDDKEPNMTDVRDSKTSEKEVFMVQYSEHL